MKAQTALYCFQAVTVGFRPCVPLLSGSYGGLSTLRSIVFRQLRWAFDPVQDDRNWLRIAGIPTTLQLQSRANGHWLRIVGLASLDLHAAAASKAARLNLAPLNLSMDIKLKVGLR
jgi:hypothetical protein